MSVKLELQNYTDERDLPILDDMQTWIKKTIKAIPSECAVKKELTIRIVTKEESSELNQSYRKKKGPTNVLSFPSAPLPGITDDALGELAICAELVREEALKQNKSTQAHWAHLIIHGILHLCGYDHVTDEQAKEMESLEVKILKQLGFPNPY